MTAASLYARADAKRSEWSAKLNIAGKHVERAAMLEALHRGLGHDADDIEYDYFDGDTGVFTCPESQAAIERAEELYIEAQVALETMMDLKEKALTLERREMATAHAVRMRHAHPVTRAVTDFLRRMGVGVS